MLRLGVTVMCGESDGRYLGVMWVFYHRILLVLAIIERGIDVTFRKRCVTRDSRRMFQIVNVAWLSVDLSPRWLHMGEWIRKFVVKLGRAVLPEYSRLGF